MNKFIDHKSIKKIWTNQMRENWMYLNLLDIFIHHPKRGQF
ncbi:hypothetical protein Leryth_017393 [Lithospermum erythrorhizon]|nr:hypothetical protein Leryth_017393 [Lithospermum erythrorhizon]